MDDQANPDLDQADEEVLTYTVSDAALEAAAGMERGMFFPYNTVSNAVHAPPCC